MNHYVAIPIDGETLMKSMQINCPDCLRTVLMAHAMNYLDIEYTYKFMEIKVPSKKRLFPFISKLSKAKAKNSDRIGKWKFVETIKYLINLLSNKSNIEKEGLFRVNGNWENVLAIYDYLKFNDFDIHQLDLSNFSIFDLASSFKRILRNHSPSVIPPELEKNLLLISKNYNETEKTYAIALLIRLLPEFMQTLMLCLFSFLKKVSLENSKMSPNTVARLFAPSLVGSDIVNLVAIMPIITLMIQNGDRLHKLPTGVMEELKVTYLKATQNNAEDIDYDYNGFSSISKQPTIETNCFENAPKVCRDRSNGYPSIGNSAKKSVDLSLSLDTTFEAVGDSDSEEKENKNYHFVE